MAAEQEPDRPILIFAYGNPSRGDDALAPSLLEAAGNEPGLHSDRGLRLLQDYQMQIEHVVDMHGCERVLLLDADQSQSKPVRFYSVVEQPEQSYTTHGMSPGQLLTTYRQMYRSSPPPTFMLAMRGYEFALGQPMSELARESLHQARILLGQLLSAGSIQDWQRLVD